jgi:hypothetical protein
MCIRANNGCNNLPKVATTLFATIFRFLHQSYAMTAQGFRCAFLNDSLWQECYTLHFCCSWAWGELTACLNISCFVL